MGDSAFPFIGAGGAAAGAAELPLFREFAWDFAEDCLLLRDGAPYLVEGAEALKVWIYKALRTQRYVHAAHSWNYGCEIWRLIGDSLSADAMASEAERMIREALLCNPYILDASDFTVTAGEDSIRAAFKVTTVYGDVRADV